MVWAIKDETIVSTFVDAGAAKFFLPSLGSDVTQHEEPFKRPRYALTGSRLSNPNSLLSQWTEIAQCDTYGARRFIIEMEN